MDVAERSYRISFVKHSVSRASDKIAISLRAANQILNKTKDFFESLKYNLKM